jgi:hypothetical protein
MTLNEDRTGRLVAFESKRTIRISDTANGLLFSIPSKI